MKCYINLFQIRLVLYDTLRSKCKKINEKQLLISDLLSVKENTIFCSLYFLKISDKKNYLTKIYNL